MLKILKPKEDLIAWIKKVCNCHVITLIKGKVGNLGKPASVKIDFNGIPPKRFHPSLQGSLQSHTPKTCDQAGWL